MTNNPSGSRYSGSLQLAADEGLAAFKGRQSHFNSDSDSAPFLRLPAQQATRQTTLDVPYILPTLVQVHVGGVMPTGRGFCSNPVWTSPCWCDKCSHVTPTQGSSTTGIDQGAVTVQMALELSAIKQDTNNLAVEVAAINKVVLGISSSFNF
eukprot:1149385-Pelagomonas_calceolata.AAC.1